MKVCRSVRREVGDASSATVLRDMADGPVPRGLLGIGDPDVQVVGGRWAMFLGGHDHVPQLPYRALLARRPSTSRRRDELRPGGVAGRGVFGFNEE